MDPNLNVQQPAPSSSIPQTNQQFESDPKTKINKMLVLSIILFVIVTSLLSAFYIIYSKNKTNNKNTSSKAIGLLPTSAPEKNKVSSSTPVSLIYVINNGELYDHNYDTLKPLESHTYISSPENVLRNEFNIGYNYADLIQQKEKYEFYTTKKGTYLVRSTKRDRYRTSDIPIQSAIEIAPSKNIESFKTIVNCSCELGDYIFSNDETKIAYMTVARDSKATLYIADFEGNKIQVKFPYPFSSSQLVAFNAYDMKLALGSGGTSYSEIEHLRSQIITVDSKGNILKTQESKYWDFLDQFSDDLKYVYIASYVKDGRIIKRYDLQTDKSEDLLHISEEGTLTSFMLSPLEDKLAFLFITGNSRYVYLINLKDKTSIRKDIDNSFAIGNDYTWSPNGKYIYLYGGDCTGSVCIIDGSGYLFDTETQEIKPYYQSKGVAEAFQDDNQAILRQIETMDFVGWLSH